MITNESLRTVPLLVLANKQDLEVTLFREFQFFLVHGMVAVVSQCKLMPTVTVVLALSCCLNIFRLDQI
jgi:hypothetical protein